MTRADEIEAQALAFHKQNPKVWELFVKFTGVAIARGFANYSAYAIFERIRWETDEADVDGKSTFKINNNYRPYYARMFMREFPHHKGFFRIRALTSDKQDATGLDELGPQDFPYLEDTK